MSYTMECRICGAINPVGTQQCVCGHQRSNWGLSILTRRNAVLVLLVLVIVGGVVFVRYTHSPKYALIEIQQALREHDIEKFEKFVDIESVTGGAVDALMAKQTAGDNLAKGMLLMLKPTIVQATKTQIRAAVEQGDADQLGKNGQSNVFLSLWKRGGGNATSTTIETLGTEGKLAFVRLSTTGPGISSKGFTVELKLRDRGDHWQIIEVSNLPKLLQDPR